MAAGWTAELPVELKSVCCSANSSFPPAAVHGTRRSATWVAAVVWTCRTACRGHPVPLAPTSTAYHPHARSAVDVNQLTELVVVGAGGRLHQRHIFVDDCMLPVMPLLCFAVGADEGSLIMDQLVSRPINLWTSNTSGVAVWRGSCLQGGSRHSSPLNCQRWEWQPEGAHAGLQCAMAPLDKAAGPLRENAGAVRCLVHRHLALHRRRLAAQGEACRQAMQRCATEGPPSPGGWAFGRPCSCTALLPGHAGQQAREDLLPPAALLPGTAACCELVTLPAYPPCLRAVCLLGHVEDKLGAGGRAHNPH